MDQSLSLRGPIHSAILRKSLRDAFREPRSISEHSTLLPDRVGHSKTLLALARGILCHSARHYVTPRGTMSLREALCHSANLNIICGTARMLPRSPNTVYRTIRTLHNHPERCLQTPCHSAKYFFHSARHFFNSAITMSLREKYPTIQKLFRKLRNQAKTI